MKIAYIGKIQLSDVDLSYLHEAQQNVDITYIMEVTPRFMKGPAFCIDKIYPKSGLFKAIDIYPEFVKFDGFIDINKFYILNTCGPLWQLKAFWTNLLLMFFIIRNKFTTLHIAWPLNVYEFILYLMGKRMLLTVHDPFPHSGQDTFIVRLRRKAAFHFVNKLIILNKKQRQEFINFYKLDERQVVDSKLSTYTYLQTVIPDESILNKDYILFFGKISRYKGLNYLLPAMLKIHEKYPNIHLVVAGKGELDASPYEKLNYIDIRNRFIKESELVTLIKNSKFVICPYTDATQSGVIMSAFAFNKPVLATRVGGLPEMVKEGVYGLLVKEKDVDALAEGIASMLSDKQRLTDFANNIFHDYSTGELSWKHIAQNLVKEY